MRDWIKQPLCIKCFFFVIVVDQTEREIRFLDTIFIFQNKLVFDFKGLPEESVEWGAFVTALVKPLFVGVKAVDASLQLGARGATLKLKLAAVHLKKNL
jgi:hypothetical protein